MTEDPYIITARLYGGPRDGEVIWLTRPACRNGFRRGDVVDVYVIDDDTLARWYAGDPQVMPEDGIFVLEYGGEEAGR